MTTKIPAQKTEGGFTRSFLRGLLRFVMRLLYRVRVIGHDHIPRSGGALFICNHVSWVDALLVGFACERHVRFMMFQGTYDLWFVKPWARVMGIIPISSEQKPRE